MGLEKQITAPAIWSLEQAKKIGKFAAYTFGQEKARDNVMERERIHTLSPIESALTVLAVGAVTRDEQEAAAELETVREFAEIYGPKNFAELEATNATGPAEPLAVKRIERMLTEKLPDPDPPLAPEVPEKRQAHS